ncbi:HNH endonuclease family protein [Streptomyces sp. MB09-02B]|uniref:HNH endonuclease family protein n=1 Tax=Streptomyces sp. MB09-02B TaxID=3028667 RepID=UPI0029BDE9F0|nr:HNH endonuclease family protein [Streptomyces sp. MB09-02B]MDX3639159.1 HNH endonuclease family protein [Streptomyces sp. MB09-02B]
MDTPHIDLSGRLGVAVALVAAFLPIPLAVAVAALWSAAPAPASVPESARLLAQPQMVPEAPPAEVVRKELAALTVEAPHSLEGYSRDTFEHWAIENHWPKTQQVVIRRDAKRVGLGTQAQSASQQWHSPYDDRILTTASQVDVDHVVPLANAWRSGADKWSSALRHKFANDLSTTQLVAVSVVANRTKGDQSPDQWVPPNTAYHCVYSRAWTHVKFTYGLSVTAKEKAALSSMLDTCS